ncbi:MAG: DUF1549 domain-containing protein [Planctomycetota bacterium]|nr:MAG: DUF1549 domain-containing protein [Planctomycetota bacterium]REJ96655.1 MAG: DUF1549 domain-containing protein [Planctomycetota bacterium]
MSCYLFRRNRLRWKFLLIAVGAGLAGAMPAVGHAESPPGSLSDTSPDDVAAEIDRLIEAQIGSPEKLAPRASDEDFLRRVSLDLAGVVPTPNDVTLFGLNPAPDKRAALIDQLLAGDDYAEIWASYFSDVIFLRATEARSRINQPVFQQWMAERLAENAPWDEIATDLITATGSVREEGSVALVFAHGGAPEELAAETSRIFLGIQMQCANCHDHPTDSWKREQFHELAAFFPRIQVRPQTAGDVRTFVVSSADDFRDNRRRFDPEQIFRRLDANRDGELVKREAERVPGIGDRFDQILANADADQNGSLSLEEFKTLRRPPMNQPGRGSAEYYMPDLNDPAAPGTRMQPVFFVTGESLETGALDLQRREALAESITSPENEWFSKAFVNRIWGEMTGQGFYMPIDDIGPERTAQMPEVLDLLAAGFTASGYDIQWLFRTIARTDVYQREIRTIDPLDAAPFAAASPTRLRSDQVYNTIVRVLGVENLAGQRTRRGPGANGPVRRDPARAAFAELFGFDPSTPQEDIVGNIPQALFLMNSPQLNALINGNADTKLGRILKEHDDDRDALAELYLLALAREPSDREIEINLEYIAEVGDRVEAFEDIQWSLLNSSEFLSRR